jgi:hypothetical protein
MLPISSSYGRPNYDVRSGANAPALTRDNWDQVPFVKEICLDSFAIACADFSVLQRSLRYIVLQNFWRVEMYDLADIAALMKSAMDDSDGHQVALRRCLNFLKPHFAIVLLRHGAASTLWPACSTTWTAG